ncbi:MAG: hypothetical protein HBSAPP03_23990 [Phycisphaerae bacterium]|nr:MAG: hypothetical protein HBSAPP03_23990 [Phycisphaerae bacterium]
MVLIRCDRCDKSIEIDRAVVGLKVECPHCGDINVLRAVAGESGTPDRAAQAGLPPARGPEVDVLVLRPAFFRSRPVAALLVFAATLGGLVGGVLLWATPLGWASLAVAGAGCVVLAVWKVLCLGSGIRITTKRVIDVEGLLSKKTSEVLHTDIKNIRVTQTFWNRVMGVGTIVISSAAENEDAVELAGTPHPERAKQTIDLYRPL